MKVLHIDEQRKWGGGEQQASWLVQGLVKRGHAVAVAGRRGHPFVDSEHGGCDVARVPLPFRGEWDLWTAWRLSRSVKKESVDILHAHTSHAHTMACLARIFAGRGKVVVSRRVSFPPKNHLLNRWKYRQPDRLLAVSERVGEVLQDFGVDGARLRVVCSAVDLARLDVEPSTRAELGLPENAPLLVTVGALESAKDHETLLGAMLHVLRAFPGARLVVAGEGALRPHIEARVNELGIGKSVTMLGHRMDAPRIIRAGDVYVSSSVFEGLGTSVLEALASSTPVVATMAGGIPEMVLEGETGYLVPSSDPEALGKAIVSSLRNRDAARTMAERGVKLVRERYQVDRMVEETLAVYEELLQDEETKGA